MELLRPRQRAELSRNGAYHALRASLIEFLAEHAREGAARPAAEAPPPVPGIDPIVTEAGA